MCIGYTHNISKNYMYYKLCKIINIIMFHYKCCALKLICHRLQNLNKQSLFSKIPLIPPNLYPGIWRNFKRRSTYMYVLYPIIKEQWETVPSSTRHIVVIIICDHLFCRCIILYICNIPHYIMILTSM